MTQPGNRGFRLPGALGRAQAATSGLVKPAVETLPKTVGGGMGNVPASPIDTTKTVPEPRRLTAAQAQVVMMAELNAAVRSLVESSTELAGRLGRRGAVNGVLESWAQTFPTGGIVVRTFEVAAGSMTIENLSAAGVVTVVTGVAAGDTGPQTTGAGVSYIRANSRGIIPLADHSVTIIGTAGDKVSWEIFTGLQAYGVDTL